MIPVCNDHSIFEAYSSDFPKVGIHVNKVFSALSGLELRETSAQIVLIPVGENVDYLKVFSKKRLPQEQRQRRLRSCR